MQPVPSQCAKGQKERQTERRERAKERTRQKLEGNDLEEEGPEKTRYQRKRRRCRPYV